MTKEKTMTNLYRKLVEVRKEIPPMPKDTEGYKYSYVSGTSILMSIRDKMNELGVLLYPSVIEHTMEREYDESIKEYGDYVVRATMDMTFVDAESGEILVIPWVGYGKQNDPSKSLGSLLTYSERYFLLKFYNVATDDDDPDKNQGNTKTKSKTETKVNKNETTLPPIDDALRTRFINCLIFDKDKSYKNIAEVNKAAEVNPDAFKKVFHEWDSEIIDERDSVTSYKSIYATLNKLKIEKDDRHKFVSNTLNMESIIDSLKELKAGELRVVIQLLKEKSQ